MHNVMLPEKMAAVTGFFQQFDEVKFFFAIRKQGFISDRAKILISNKVDRLNVALFHIYTYF